ncbi:hypothetical protein FRC12_019343 [Ceratobasidium sp. 428]|nr:hypothetical protein FRC12_019343 [Ceratobasidium sp. 428]
MSGDVYADYRTHAVDAADPWSTWPAVQYPLHEKLRTQAQAREAHACWRWAMSALAEVLVQVRGCIDGSGA